MPLLRLKPLFALMNLLSGLISTLIPLAPLFQKAEAKEKGKGDDSIYRATPFQR